jgi:hypothetical protein
MYADGYTMFKFKFKIKVLFKVDIKHTYNTSSNELLKSTIVYKKTTHTIMHTNILNKNMSCITMFILQSMHLLTIKRCTYKPLLYTSTRYIKSSGTIRLM